VRQVDGKKLKHHRKNHRCGKIMTHLSSNRNSTRLTIMDTIKCQIMIVGGKTTVKVNTCGTMVIHTAKIPIRISGILQKMEKRTGKILEEHPDSLKPGETGMVLIRPEYLAFPDRLAKQRPRKKIQWANDGYCVDTFANCPQLGRFVILFGMEGYLYGCCVVGIIKEINPST